MALKSLAISVLAILTCASCAPVQHEQAAQAEPGPRIVRHADLARTIVRMMGDEAKLPAAATALDYQNYLAGKGIAPLRGWRYSEPVTKGDLAVVTVRLLGLQRQVEDPKNEASYIALLESIELRAIAE
jgi:hypothetical protein